MKIPNNKIKVIIKDAKWTSWAELKAFSEAGELDEILKSGDNIPVMLKNGDKVSFDIGKDESGTIYFIMHSCLKDRKPMNAKETNEGGWEASDMRKYLNEEIIKLLPDELQEVIKPTKIVQILKGKKQETEDKLFLLSRTQILGKDGWYELIDSNDSQIDIFKSRRERIKESDDYEISHDWWLRSPYDGYSKYFCMIDADGGVDCDSADYSWGVIPAFCI